MSKLESLFKHQFLPDGTQLMEDFFSGFLIEDNVIIDPKGVITTGMVVFPIEKDQYSGKDFEVLNESINNAVKMLPPWTTIHKQSFYSSPDERPLAASIEGEGYFTRNLKRHLNDVKVNRVGMHLYISFSTTPISNQPFTTPISNFWRRIKAALQASPVEHKLLVRKRAALEATQALADMINSIKGIKVKPLLSEELKLRITAYMSLNQFKKDISFESGIAVDGPTLQMGLKNVAVVRMNQPGEAMHTHVRNKRGLFGFMTEGLGVGLNCPHIVNEVMIIKDTQAALSALRTQVNLIRAVGSAGNGSNIEILGQYEEFMSKAVNSDTPIVELHHNVIVWAYDKERLNTYCNEIVTAYANANGSYGLIEDIDTLNWFTCMTPGYAHSAFNGKMMLSREALCNFDWSVETLTENQGIIVANRSNELVHLDLWANWLNSKNACVIGPTGSGKSFFTNNWIVQWFEQGFDLVILDVGGSYKNVVQLLGGKYMDYDPANPIEFNPFMLPKNQDGLYVLNDEKRVFLISLISTMWKDAAQGEVISKEEESFISEFLELYIQDHNKNNSVPPKLAFFYAWLSDEKNQQRVGRGYERFNMNGLLRVLKRFCEGEYKTILNADTNTDIAEERLVCFDLDSVKNIPSLRPVIALLIIELVLDKMRNRLHVRKGIFMDEAWSFLGGSPELANFMEYLFRTCRKMNAASVVITQSVLELSTSKVGKAIANNTPIKVILDHAGKSDQFPDLESFLGFSPLDIDKIRSIKRTDQSREFFIKREDHSQVFMLDAGPVASTAFSSTPTDRVRMRELLKKYRKVDYAINQLVEEKMST